MSTCRRAVPFSIARIARGRETIDLRGRAGDAAGENHLATLMERIGIVHPSAWAALELEQVLELGEGEEESEFVVRVAQDHRGAVLSRLALDQHQDAKSG